MGSVAQTVSLAEYLKSDYEPDAEYVDGKIEERPMGEDDHSEWQKAICIWFDRESARWGIRVRPELRVQVSPTRFRVPDVTILDRQQPREKIATSPPLAVFEILSPEDTMQRMLRKLADYDAMGIPEVWVLDPDTRIFSRHSSGQLRREDEFSLSSKGINFPLKNIEALLE